MDNAGRDPLKDPAIPAAEQGFEDIGVTNDPSFAGAAEKRRMERYTLLIRAAKIVTAHGEFIGVIRDVSEAGLSLRLFHNMPQGDPIELHMPGGTIYNLRSVWSRELEAGFEFDRIVDVAQLINEVGEFPKRGLRLGLVFPVRLRTLTGTFDGVVENLSQQGARVDCNGRFAIDQTVRIECLESAAELGEVRAKVRWRRDSQYGVVFEDTLTLRDFALLAARLQDPGLLDGAT